jgi:hypothetical protein
MDNERKRQHQHQQHHNQPTKCLQQEVERRIRKSFAAESSHSGYPKDITIILALEVF